MADFVLIKDSHLRHWLIIFTVLAVSAWLFQSILFPFAFGILLAYLFQPSIRKLEDLKVSRHIAALLCTFLILLVNTALIFLIVPVIRKQFLSIVENAPGVIEQGREAGERILDKFEKFLGPNDLQHLEETADAYLNESLVSLAEAFGSMITGGSLLFYLFSMLFVAPFLAYYMMGDWNKFTEALTNLFPKEERKRARKIGNKINSVVAGFLRGQLGVCLASMVYYAIAFSLIGMNYPILIAILVGLTVFIPYVGLAMGAVLTLGIAIYQFQTLPMVALVVAIFGVGQFLEDYVFIPRFVGNNIQLHPALTLFSIMAGGSLLGVPGLIIGAPVAGIIAVFIREFHGVKEA